MSSEGNEPIHPEGAAEPGFEIANEFARVEVCKRHTRNGVRLEITAPRLGSRILLDALLLESLTWQNHEALSRLFSTPFEPTALRSPVDDEEGH